MNDTVSIEIYIAISAEFDTIEEQLTIALLIFLRVLFLSSSFKTSAKMTLVDTTINRNRTSQYLITLPFEIID